MGFLEFVDGSYDLSQAMTGTFSPGLVVLSILVASIAAYSALLTTERVRNATSTLSRRIWFATGSVAMGAGIWTMHFVGMLAYSMNMPVSYDVAVTALSAIPGVAASGIALHIMRGSSASWWRLNAGGLLMGGGIGAMHYAGMAAMVMPATTAYEPKLFALSILVAHGLATLSLAAKFRFVAYPSRESVRLAASALLMGFAVAGMHYTAMLASLHFPDMTREVPTAGLSPGELGLGVSAATGLILGLSILSSIVDRRLQGISRDLQESEERTRVILETAADGIVAFDEHGTISTFNAAAGEIFGMEQSAAVGANVGDLIDANDQDAIRAWIATYGGGETDRALRRPREIVGRRQDGETFPLQMTASRCVVSGMISFAAVLRDLSEERALEARLLQAQKLESIGQLAAGIAHEINTPAQFVSDNLEFIEDSFSDLTPVFESVEAILDSKGQDSGEALLRLREFVEKADLDFLSKELPGAVAQSRDGIARVAEIVKAMKDFSHPGAEGFQSIDLNRAIESTVTVARNEWKYIAELEFDLDATLRHVPCRAGEFNQSVLNILVNAAHAIDARRGDSSELGKIRVSTREDGGFAEVRIQDDGGGIPREAQSRVFDPFFTTKGVGKGTGQGLAIAYSSIVEKHGGTLDFEVEPDVGTTFVIRLPLERVDLARADEEKES